MAAAAASSAFVAAEELYATRQFAASERHYLEAAAAGHPKQAWCHNRRGLCMSQLGRGAEALGCYDAAVQAEPLSAMLRHNRGYRRLRLGHDEGARTDLRLAANLGGESKWGRQARRLLREHWDERVNRSQEDDTAATPKKQQAQQHQGPSTPSADRFARGNRTVETWLQQGSVSPAEMLHHSLDSVGGPLTMTSTPMTPQSSAWAAAAGGHVAGADTGGAQGLPLGFSISSPMPGTAAAAGNGRTSGTAPIASFLRPAVVEPGSPAGAAAAAAAASSGDGAATASKPPKSPSSTAVGYVTPPTKQRRAAGGKEQQPSEQGRRPNSSGSSPGGTGGSSGSGGSGGSGDSPPRSWRNRKGRLLEVQTGPQT